MIGAAFDSWMLYPQYVPGETPNSLVWLEAVADHVDHVVPVGRQRAPFRDWQRPGRRFRQEQSPNDLNTILDLQKIPGLLRNKGFKEADVERVMHGNWLRFFERALPKR
jgi:membrane dipeptidase